MSFSLYANEYSSRSLSSHEVHVPSYEETLETPPSPPPLHPKNVWDDPSLRVPTYTDHAMWHETVLATAEDVRLENDQEDPNSMHRLESPTLSLTLGPRNSETSKSLPIFRTGGSVEGFVDVSSFRNVRKVDVTIHGILTIVEYGLLLPVMTIDRPVLQDTMTLFSGKASAGLIAHGGRLPFSWKIPGNLPQIIDLPLPHSCDVSFANVKMSVQWFLTVDLYRTGLHRHERVRTEWLHLPAVAKQLIKPPKASGSSSAPPVNEYVKPRPTRPQPDTLHPLQILNVSEERLGTFEVPHSKRNELGFSVAVKLLKPYTFSIGVDIPVRVVVSADQLSLAQSILANSCLQLVKITTVLVGDHQVHNEEVLSESNDWRCEIQPPSESSNRFTIVACNPIESDVKGVDLSWRYPNLIDVRYGVRISCTRHSSSDPSTLPEFIHTVNIALTN